MDELFANSRMPDSKREHDEVGCFLDSRELNDVDLALAQNPTEDNVALIFRNLYAGKLLFDHSISKWLEWNGHCWVIDRTGSAFNCTRSIARKINAQGKPQFAKASFIAGVERFTSCDPAFSITSDEFDKDNYLLNTPGGVVDLRTNILRPANASDYLTKSTKVTPSSSGGERFLKFMDEITCGDNELVKFHQMSLGACLSGAVEAHWMLFWIGSGRNGKNTLGDLFEHTLGDYADTVKSSLLMSRKYEEHPTEIANLRGLRVACSSEVAKNAHWDEGRVNEITGNARLSARKMRGDFFSFDRTHKHLVYGNHRPQIRTDNQAIRSRIKMVPFDACFLGKEDYSLPDKLKEEAGFFLGWLIEGHDLWLKDGRKLPQCAAVDGESADYFESQSTVSCWVEERTLQVGNESATVSSWPKASDLYADFSRWKESRGEGAQGMVIFSEELAKLGYQKAKSNGVRYAGIMLRSGGVDASNSGDDDTAFRGDSGTFGTLGSREPFIAYKHPL